MAALSIFLCQLGAMFVGYKTGRDDTEDGTPWFALIGSAIGLLMGAFLLSIVINNY